MPESMYAPRLVDVKKYVDLFLSSYEPILQSIGVRLDQKSDKFLLAIAEEKEKILPVTYEVVKIKRKTERKSERADKQGFLLFFCGNKG